MSTISREDILDTLHKVAIPGGTGDVVSAGMVSGITIRSGAVGFLITIDPQARAEGELLREKCEQALSALPGVEKVTIVLTAESAAASQAPPAQPARPQAQWNRLPVAHVKHVIIVASGKGGVGKSTVSACLAYALENIGKRVGLLDADIYGPSLPRMMGLLDEKPEVREGKLVPLQKGRVQCMSVGFLMGNEAAVLRGPMISKALQQMVRQVAWGTAEEPLDVLILDLPPGTGDVQLSLAQQVAINGAVIVTTPQQLAVSDARKAVQMFEKVGVPMLGVVENMSYFTQPDTGDKIYLFGQGGGRQLAKEMKISFLGQIPILPELGTALDEGLEPELPVAFASIVEDIIYAFKTNAGAA